jgi:hypothetical protein
MSQVTQFIRAARAAEDVKPELFRDEGLSVWVVSNGGLRFSQADSTVFVGFPQVYALLDWLKAIYDEPIGGPNEG